jgi:transcriptional regulator with XRE-family HTH domain
VSSCNYSYVRKVTFFRAPPTFIGRENSVSAFAVAKELGLSHVALGNFLKGQEPKSKHLYALANYFDVNMSWLLTGLGPKELIQADLTQAVVHIIEESPFLPASPEDAAKVIGGLSMEFLTAPKAQRNHLVEQIKETTERLSKLQKVEADKWAKVRKDQFKEMKPKSGN